MALIKCEECHHDMSDKAKQCPYCGFIRQEKIICSECNTENKENNKICKNCGAPIKRNIHINFDLIKSKKLIIPIIVIIICLLIFTGYNMLFNNKNGMLASVETKMWNMVQEEVAKNLKQPDSAEFEDISKVRFFLVKENTYEVIGIVKGKNAMGVTVSNNFVATVSMENEKPIKVTNVEFVGDETLRNKITTNEELNDRLENNKPFLTVQELEQEIKKQPLYVENAIYQDASKFYSSSSMLQAVIYNNSNVSIKNVEVGFVAWDKNKLPVLIKGWASSSNGKYFSSLTYDAINLLPQKRYNGINGDNYYGLRVDEDLDITYLKAIVISYEDFDGSIWTNPLLIDFKNLYENKKLD